VQATYLPTDLTGLTADLVSTFTSAMELAGLVLQVDLQRLPDPVYVDRDMWEKVVLNLLSNAFKYTLQGEIEVRLRQVGEHAVLSVRDTGIGIPPEALPKLFERFYRVEGAEGRTHEGSGIGLALVHELVKLHGGTVSAESRLKEGSTLTVRIPLGSSHLPIERIGAAKSLQAPAVSARQFVEEVLRWLPETVGASQEVAPLAMKMTRTPTPRDAHPRAAVHGSRVIVADDNSDMRAYVRELLESRYKVEAVADGQAALEAARRETPDLIVSDVMMPRMDGFGLLRALRADLQLRDVPTILLSARAGEEAVIEGLDAMADDYLVKPFSARELIARVGAQLQLTRLRREATTQKNEFLAMLAHELRNPLAPIRNAGEILSRTLPVDSPGHAMVAMVKRQVSQLTRLVDDLLDVSRITQGRVELQRRPLELGSVVSQAIETAEPLFHARQHEVSIVSSYRTLYVNGDLTRLVQCVVNILTNAAKYTDTGGKIRVETRLEGSDAVITVADSGAGISPELLPRVFDLFAQGERTLDRSLGGLGIGLSVAKRLIEMHGGRVTAASPGLGLGATFEIRLPRLERPSEVSGRGESIKAASRRILIVDDNADAANSLAQVLALDGHVAEPVYSARSALNRAAAFAPEVVLLDLGLPEMDGYEVAHRLRLRPEFGAVRIVALTGYGQTGDLRRSWEAGFDDHLTKPVDFAALERVLAGSALPSPSD
jgi:signal transduction histidine kinase